MKSSDNLTPTEYKIASLVVQGRTAQQVADELHIKRTTLGVHLYALRVKCGLVGVPYFILGRNLNRNRKIRDYIHAIPREPISDENLLKSLAEGETFPQLARRLKTPISALYAQSRAACAALGITSERHERRMELRKIFNLD